MCFSYFLMSFDLKFSLSAAPSDRQVGSRGLILKS